MKTGRLEAFSDGVLAIIITIMVLGISAPEDYTFNALTRKIHDKTMNNGCKVLSLK